VFGPPLGTTPQPAIPNAKPVGSCESFAIFALPNTTIEAVAVDPANPSVCSVMAVATHSRTGDKVTSRVAIPTSNWNRLFLGPEAADLWAAWPRV
jgi:hypothetical protein